LVGGTGTSRGTFALHAPELHAVALADAQGRALSMVKDDANKKRINEVMSKLK
jgi:hypothetical protein